MPIESDLNPELEVLEPEWLEQVPSYHSKTML